MKKSKGIFFIFILIILSLMTSCVSSGTESESKDEPELIISEGLEFEMNEDENSYSVVGFGTWQGLELVIPSEYNNLPVTTIGEFAFGDDFFCAL